MSAPSDSLAPLTFPWSTPLTKPPVIKPSSFPSTEFATPSTGFAGHGTASDLASNWRVQFRDADGIPLNMQSFEQVDFGAISYKEIFQNAKTILATTIMSCALERTLGVDARIVDLPINRAAEATVALLQALYFWEPRVEVVNIDFDADVINGHLIATLQLKIRNVIYGTDTPYTQANVFNVPARVTEELPPVNQPVLIPGPPGPAGRRGSLWFVGTGPPGDFTFNELLPFDLYLDSATGDVFQYLGATGGGFGAASVGAPKTSPQGEWKVRARKESKQ